MKQQEANKYLDVFKKYDDTIDFSRFPLEIEFGHINRENIPDYIHVKGIFDAGLHRWNSDRKILTIRPYKDSSSGVVGIRSIETEPLNIDLLGEEKYVDWHLYRTETGLKMAKVCMEHGTDVVNGFMKVNSDDEAFPMMQAIAAVDHFVQRIENYKTESIKDFIYRNNGITLDKLKTENNDVSIYTLGYDGNTKNVDELFFTQNPSGTYTVYLKLRGNIVSQTNRASQINLDDNIDLFANRIRSYHSQNWEVLLK